MNCNDRQFLGLDQATKMALSRRTFIKGSAGGIGLAALGSLMGTPAFAANPGLGFPNFKPRRQTLCFHSPNTDWLKCVPVLPWPPSMWSSCPRCCLVQHFQQR